jgi:hypothetical protein
METIMTPDFWPEGVCVKRFYKPKENMPRRTTAKIGDDSSNDQK